MLVKQFVNMIFMKSNKPSDTYIIILVCSTILTELQIYRNYLCKCSTMPCYKMFIIHTINSSCSCRQWHTVTSYESALADTVSARPKPSCPLHELSLHRSTLSLLALLCTSPAVPECNNNKHCYIGKIQNFYRSAVCKK